LTKQGNVSILDPAAEDAALVVAAKSGDGHAFEILVGRHEQRILFVAQRITRTREDAEDVVQQSFQKAFTHLRKFEGRSAFSTWLTRIAITEALMFLRRNRGLREMLIDDLNEGEETGIPLEFRDSSPHPEDIYAQREQAEMLSSAINELPYRTRRAIQLRKLGERSSEETARIMGISVSALKGRMFHGRRKLREKLKHFIEPAWTSARKTSRTIGKTKRISQDQVLAMRVVKAGMTRGPYGDLFLCRCIGDFGFSVFHRPGRYHWPAASSVNRRRGGSIPTGE
jgi:RNA polymerase sigma-70 factor (ECF subfamily)